MTEAERLNDLRRRVLDGDSVSIEEYRELIQSLRAKRTGDIAVAAEKKATRKAASPAKAPEQSLDELLGGFGL